jgi:uncharacterized membrane protein YgcG
MPDLRCTPLASAYATSHVVSERRTHGMVPAAKIVGYNDMYVVLRAQQLPSLRRANPVACPKEDCWQILTALLLACHARAQEPAFTTKDHRGPKTLDYIWLGGSCRLAAVLSMPWCDSSSSSSSSGGGGGGGGGSKSGSNEAGEVPTKKEGERAATFVRMPNLSFPSDHLALGCTLRLPHLSADE